MSERRKPRLVVLNQYYWPGVEATAHLLTELCEALAEDFEVSVVTGRLHDRDDAPVGTFDRNGVTVTRVKSTAFDRRRLLPRGVNYVTFFLQALRRALATPRPNVVLAMTDPPFIGNVAWIVARRFRVPFVVISQDVFPEVAVELKRLENPLLVSALRVLTELYLRRADAIVAIGETMRQRLEAKGAPPGRVRVIPNWTDTSKLTPQPKSNAWAIEQGLEGRFVVMHSGNIGHAQNLDALIRASTFLRDLERLVIVIIGGGARLAELVDLARRLEADAVQFLGYQPRGVLSQSLSAADVHVVGLASGLSGFVVPSRLYGVLSVGRPVIAAADVESETAQVVMNVDCGIVVPPGRPELLAQEIRRAYDGELPLAAMGERARAYVVGEADREVAIRRYRELLAELIRPRA